MGGGRPLALQESSSLLHYLSTGRPWVGFNISTQLELVADNSHHIVWDDKQEEENKLWVSTEISSFGNSKLDGSCTDHAEEDTDGEEHVDGVCAQFVARTSVAQTVLLTSQGPDTGPPLAHRVTHHHSLHTL